MKKLVIFDLDGTLLSTLPDLAAAANHALAENGCPVHSEAAIASFTGNGITRLIERALPEGHRSEDEILRTRECFVSYYDRHGTDLTAPYPGIPELLKGLQEAGIQIAVASNKYQEATGHLIRHYFPGIRFSAVLGQRSGIPSKPDPAIVADICRLSGIRQEERDSILYIGDSEVDMQTAINASLDAVAVTWGFRKAEELEKFHPRWTVHSPEEISAIALEK